MADKESASAEKAKRTVAILKLTGRNEEGNEPRTIGEAIHAVFADCSEAGSNGDLEETDPVVLQALDGWPLRNFFSWALQKCDCSLASPQMTDRPLPIAGETPRARADMHAVQLSRTLELRSIPNPINHRCSTTVALRLKLPGTWWVNAGLRRR